MKVLDQLGEKLKIVPKLKLGTKLEGGGVKSNGPIRVKFVEEPTLIQGMSHEGKPQEEVKFIVEVDGIKCKWNVPVFNKQHEAHYLMEKLQGLQVGEEKILEMKKAGAKNYIDVREVDEAPSDPSLDEGEE